jgi:hypothetical protein
VRETGSRAAMEARESRVRCSNMGSSLHLHRLRR